MLSATHFRERVFVIGTQFSILYTLLSYYAAVCHTLCRALSLETETASGKEKVGVETSAGANQRERARERESARVCARERERERARARVTRFLMFETKEM